MKFLADIRAWHCSLSLPNRLGLSIVAWLIGFAALSAAVVNISHYFFVAILASMAALVAYQYFYIRCPKCDSPVIFPKGPLPITIVWIPKRCWECSAPLK